MPFVRSLAERDKVPHALAGFNNGSTRPLLELHQALMRGDSPFTVWQRELIAAFVSSVNACTYCTGAHRAVTAEFGVSAELIDQVLADIDSANVNAALKPVLHYAGKLTLTPAEITQGDADRVLDAGWSERAFYDLVEVTALFNFMNRFVEGLGLNAMQDDFRMEGRLLHDKGYTGILDGFEIR